MMRFSLKKFMKKNLLKFLAFHSILFSSQLFFQDLETLKQQKESLKIKHRIN